MLPTSRPANYSNSQDFRLAGGRRQILTKNIKPSSVPARLSDGRRSVSSISLREPEDRHHVAHLSILIQKREPRPIRVPSGDGVEIRVRNSKPERLLCPDPSAYRFPYYRGTRDTCGTTQRGRDAAWRVSDVARPQPRMHIAHDRGKRNTGWELVGT